MNLADDYQNLFTRVHASMNPAEGLAEYLKRELEALHFRRDGRTHFFDKR